MANTSKSLRSYDDVKALLEQAREARGLRLEFQNHRVAAAFVGRANAYRRLIRERNERDFNEYSSDYDSLLFTREKQSKIVIIRHQMLPVSVTTLAGEDLDLPPIIETPSHDVKVSSGTISADELNFLNELELPGDRLDD